MLSRPVRLADTPMAPNPRRLRIFLAEKGIEIPTEAIDVMKGEHRTPEYIAWAGAATVPAVELEDGIVLTETVAIFRYMEALHPEPNLMGRDPLEAAVIEMWHRRVEFGLLQHVAAVVRHLHPKMSVLEKNQVPAWGEANRPRVENSLRELDRRLEDNQFIAVERYSVVDITAQVVIDFLPVARISVSEDLVHLCRWLEQVRARPSASA